MKEQHENRRVRMTRQLMKDALLELLGQQELVNISVTAICKTADVHRSTFYKHYKDPADLLKDIEQDILDRIPSPPQTPDQLDQEELLLATSSFFDYVKENKKAFQILFSERAGNTFAAKLVEYLCSGYVFAGNVSDELTGHFICLYIANGTVGMLREWIHADFPTSSRTIAEMMYFLSGKITY